MMDRERRVGDRVFVTADNYGSPAVIVAARESGGSFASHYKVKADAGEAFWAFDFEITDLEDGAQTHMPDSTADTLEHISKVGLRIGEIITNLRRRAHDHDASKLVEPEKSGFDVLTFKLASLVYGSEEYKAALEEGKPTIAHHYAHNSHHPEHYENGIAGMSLLDVIEMLADWRAASERLQQGSILASLEHNRIRFGIDDQLYAILCNTVKE